MKKCALLIAFFLLANTSRTQDPYDDDKSGTIRVRKATIALYAERAGINNGYYKHVTSFYFSAWSGDGQPIQSSMSNELTPSMQDKIRVMTDSAKVHGLDEGMNASFERITALDSTGKEISLPSFTVAIK